MFDEILKIFGAVFIGILIVIIIFIKVNVKINEKQYKYNGIITKKEYDSHE